MVIEMKENNFEFLTSHEVKKSQLYQKISRVLSGMIHTGAMAMGNGFCISMSDMVRMALFQDGIESQLVECQVTISYGGGDYNKICYLGFDEVRNPGELDTHVVVVTKTEPSFLIDASIQSRLPQGKPVLVDLVDERTVYNPYSIISNYEFLEYGMKLTYQAKSTQKVPKAHQISIIDRINTDQKILSKLRYCIILNYWGIGLSSFALIAVIHQILRWWIWGNNYYR